MTDDEIYLGIALTLILAAGSQILASKLRVPALIILLPAGFTAGALTDVIHPDELMGRNFDVLVSMSVAVILYDAGLGLNLRKLTGRTRWIVGRLLLLGVLVTFLITAAVAPAMFDMPLRVASMLGVILVVSGPTVVGPLLDFVRPTDKVRRILIWEGTLTDPIGAILGALVFHAISTTHQVDIGRGYQLGQFALSMAVGLAGGAVGTAILWLTLRTLRLGETLGTLAQLATVIVVSAGADIIREDTGLIAAIVTGLAVTNISGFDMPARRPFFETLAQLIIGLLFVSISSTITPASLVPVLLPLPGPHRGPRPPRPSARRLRVDRARRAVRGRTGLRRMDGPARHRRRGHGNGLLREPRGQRSGGGRQDPSCDVPRDRRHGAPVRPERGPGRETARHRQTRRDTDPARGRRAVGGGSGKEPEIGRPRPADVGGPGAGAPTDRGRRYPARHG